MMPGLQETGRTSEAYTISIPQSVYKPCFDKIPAELRERNQWVVWRYELNGDGKETKVPYQANGTGKNANISDPSTWGSLEAAKATYESDGYDGILFAISKGDPYTIIDFDDALDESGTIEPRVAKYMREMKSYTEVSPSGTGIHIIVKGSLPPYGRKKGDIEMYDSGHFMSITGHPCAGYDLRIHEKQGTLNLIHSEVFGDYERTARENDFSDIADYNPVTDEDNALLQKAFASKNGEGIKALYAGNWHSSYISQSEADLKLCSDLAWWCDYADPARVDRLFRHSGLRREKWDDVHYSDGATYGQRTLEVAFSGKKVGDGYTPKELNSKVAGSGNESRAEGLTFTDYFGDNAVKVTPPGMLVGAPFSIPLGYVAALGGLGGTGKSVLAARLAVSVALGMDFLNAQVQQGNVLYLDFELDACVTIPRIEAICRGLGAKAGQLQGKLEYMSLTAGGMLFGNVLPDLKITLERMQPKLVVIDAYQAAFGGDPSDREKVPENIKTLVSLAGHYGCTVLYLDHKSKDQKGFSSQTLYGSVFKQNFARSVAMLSETKTGILKYETVKANFGPKAPPFGISCEWTKDSREENVIRFSLADLEDGEALTDKERITRAASFYLEENSGRAIPRKKLVEVAHEGTGAATRYCEKVLDEWLTNQVKTGQLVEHKTKGRGNPKGYEMPLPEY